MFELSVRAPPVSWGCLGMFVSCVWLFLGHWGTVSWSSSGAFRIVSGQYFGLLRPSWNVTRSKMRELQNNETHNGKCMVLLLGPCWGICFGIWELLGAERWNCRFAFPLFGPKALLGNPAHFMRCFWLLLGRLRVLLNAFSFVLGFCWMPFGASLVNARTHKH